VFVENLKETLNLGEKISHKLNPQSIILLKGPIGAGKNYTLYDVGTDNTQFVQAGYKTEKRIKGFGRL